MPPAPDAMPVIDLGAVYQSAADDALAQRPERLRSLRYRIGVPLAMILLFMSASAPAPAAPLPQVAHIVVGDGASLLVHGDYAYVLDVDGHRNVLRAYPLDHRSRGWDVTIAELPADSTMRAAGDMVLVSMDAEQVTGDVHTEAFDAATGRRLWWSADGVFGLADNGDVFLESKVEFPMVGVPDSPVATGGWGFRRVASRTGRTIWTVGIPLDCYQQVAVHDPAHGMPEGLFELCGAAPELRVIDLDTGADRADRHISTSGNVPVFPPPPASAPLAPQAMVFGDIVIVLHAENSTATIDGFRLADLQPAWSGIGFAPWQMVTDCGSYVCLLSRSGDSIIDPQTGKALPGRSVRDTLPPLQTGFVIAPDGTQTTPAEVHRVDAVGDGVAVLVPTPVDGSAWIARLTAGTDITVTPIEKLAGAGAGACLQMDRYLACSTTLDSVTIWRLPG